jgi:3-hydroxyacyl-[acyl-carrier-protein] dehydratase
MTNGQDQTAHGLSQVIVDLLPHGPGFRFLDRILEIDATHIVGQYTFDPRASFYPDHFPGNPVTPGVILVETMGQTAVVAMGIYLMKLAQEQNPTEDPKDYATMFTDCTAEFLKPVLPGETVTVRGELVYWRRKKIRAKAELFLANGELAVTGILSGIGVKRS